MSGKKDEETTAFFQVPEGLLRRARGEDAPPDTERQPGALRASPSTPATPLTAAPIAAPTAQPTTTAPTAAPIAVPMSAAPWEEATAQWRPMLQDDGHTLAVSAPVPPTAPPPSAVPSRPPQRPLVDPPRLRRTPSRPLDLLPELEPKNERLPEEDTLVNFQRDELFRKPK